MKNPVFFSFSVLSASMLIACTSQPLGAQPVQIMFDDFTYTRFEQAQDNGWQLRSDVGHPGIKNAIWWHEGVSFHADPHNPDNRVMRLTSKTDGSAENTRHVQVCHKRKYLEGTYAARVFFTDKPQYGPDGDGVIQTFYAISPLAAPMDKNYSEMDFEYLPNGGWGTDRHALFATSWETFQLTPWTKVNAYDYDINPLEGWNTLVLQVGNSTLKYYINGKLYAEHGSNVYPEVAMSINFNQWFDPNKIINSNEMRQYYQDVDWVYFVKDKIVAVNEVGKQVEQLRKQNVRHKDTVPSSGYDDYCSL